MPITKDFKTIDEQIAGLASRKLKFKNRQKAAEILKKYNYFDVINGFESILLKKSSPVKVYEGVYFEDFVDLFFFDMKLKKYTLFKIFDIESRLRTSIAYNFASVYCRTPADTMNYTDPGYYKAPSPADTHMSNIFSSFDLFRPTLYFPNGTVKRKSFIELKDADAFEQALFVLKEVRNQCAHLELITRFRLKRKSSLNNFQDITIMGGLSHGKLNYLDVMKIFNLFGKSGDIKSVIARFYCKMTLKRRKKIAYKALAMMGRKKLLVWLKL